MWVNHGNYYTIANSDFIYYKPLSVGCLWSRFLWRYRSFISTSASSANRKLSSSILSAIRFLFLDLTCFIVEKVLSHKYVIPNIECIFSAKSFILGNLSWLTNFQKLPTVSNTVNVGYIFMKMCYDCSSQNSPLHGWAINLALMLLGEGRV